MFDVGFSELMVIGVVALIVVGPKDLPVMFRTVGRYVGKAKAMAREFQRSMDDAADAAGLKEVQKDLKSATSSIAEVSKYANPGFAATSEAKKQFKKILDAKESGEPLVEDADDSVAGVQEDGTAESAPESPPETAAQPEPAESPRVVEIVEETPPAATPAATDTKDAPAKPAAGS